MIIILILIALTALFTIGFIVGLVRCFDDVHTLHNGIFFAMFVFALFACGLGAGIVNSSISTREYLIEYKETVTSLNSTKNIIESYTDDNKVYLVTMINDYNADVAKFKTDILTHQYDLKNPWVSWFVNPIWNEFDADAVSYLG